MKKRFIVKRPKRKIIPYFSFFACILCFLVIYHCLNISPIKLTDKELVTYLLKKSSFLEDDNFYSYIKSKLVNIYNEPINYLLIDKNINLKDPKNNSPPKPVVKEETEENPIIYIYNSHQTEEYAASSFVEFSVNPTVMIANYILEEQFNKASYKTLVEERNIKEVLNKNSWNYAYSYRASRVFLEDVKKTTPSLKYFIDVHRDSLPKNKTTVEINGKKYAKLLFLIGLENPTYQENLKFTEEINAKINEKYPNLSKGIYKKSGPGVNGVYNQDFSPRSILIEMGGYQNTPTEVMNSTLAFAECYLEVIKSYETNISS